MRTEGDTWDIVSSVGMTALQVAAGRAVEAQQPDALVRDEFAALFVAAAGDPDTIRLVNEPEQWDEHPLTTGFLGLRSKFFDDLFRDAAADGVRQAVILAAGLDARAYRLDWPAGSVVYEIDQPKVLEFKGRVLDEAGAAPRADRRPVAVDLRDDWPRALTEAGFDPAVPTVWSAEGLLMYLPGAAQDALFARVDRLSAPGSRLAADTVAGDMDFERIRDFHAEHPTPFANIDISSLLYTDDRADPAEWLTGQGWRADTLPAEGLAERYDRPLTEVLEPFAQMFSGIRYLTAVKPS
ncbi:methyltransferase (TIGR00027 family) [Nocardia tenerifensis]|uniref:S-adenosyl-L-methionine-dependent methyltransferase n=1 Tax=Nocardia tenerifensis TaxID=228006 RepID=A0A318KIZ4_9NOCA|nr:class I SAM-dependent methyltransferase [Nocardia tenerifensis]PXX60937.1 methyltransferase (TIGR00027 family) [Nocardia tenerifensis]